MVIARLSQLIRRGKLGPGAPRWVAHTRNLGLSSWAAVEALFFSGSYTHARRIPKRLRHDWSRPLPRPLAIPTVMHLETLADVRVLVEKHLPAQLRAKPHWRYVAAQLNEAAQGAHPADVAAALVIALALDGVKCRPK